MDPELEEEVVDGLPVLVEAEVSELAPVEHGSVTVVQAAAMTAGGFFVGALAMALLKGLAGRRASDLPVVREPVSAPTWPVGSSRTYLVNVRVVTRPE
jgi:hypothetical protein